MRNDGTLANFGVIYLHVDIRPGYPRTGSDADTACRAANPGGLLRQHEICS